MSFIEELQRRIYQKTEMFGTWLPTDRMRVGEYGYLSRGCFRSEGHVRDLGVVCEEDSFPAKNSKLGFSDRAEFAIRAGMNASSGEVKGGAGLEIALHAKGAFVYHLQEILSKQILAKAELYRQLACTILTHKVRWQDQFVFVDEVREAGSATVFVSETDEASIVLGGNIAGVSEADAPLASIKGRVSVQINRGSVFRAVCAKSTTPLYRVRRFSFEKGNNKPKGNLSMLYSWFRENFGREVIKIDEIKIHEFVTTKNVDKLVLRDEVTGLTFSLKSHCLTLKEFLGSGGGPHGPGGGGVLLEHEIESKSSVRVRRVSKRAAYGRQRP